jgi:hypothetical protein
MHYVPSRIMSAGMEKNNTSLRHILNILHHIFKVQIGIFGVVVGILENFQTRVGKDGLKKSKCSIGQYHLSEKSG